MKWNTPIYQINDNENMIYIKRDDLIPYSFGGNKARKAFLFFEEIDRVGADFIVTYGSACSNHCRIIANMACERGIPCIIISPLPSHGENSYNAQMMKMFNAKIVMCPVDEVHQKIEKVIKKLEDEGYQPYFIAGGGHGNIGTKAYVDCYEEICMYENNNDMKFDYIFHASGTGTTQAGLVCGQLINNDSRKIIGISIARKAPYGKDIVLDSVTKYLKECNIQISKEKLHEVTIFDDSFVGSGYGTTEGKIDVLITDMMSKKGIPMDQTYTGKAYYGMEEYIKKNGLSKKNILFIHTGGTPLFFDYLSEIVC